MTDLTKTLIVAILALAVVLAGAYWYKTNQESVQGQPEQQEKWDDWEIGDDIYIQPKEPKNEPKNEPTRKATSYEDALKLSNETGKPVFLYFSADWCPACKKMERVLSEDKVQKALENYVSWHVDTNTERDLTRQYDVTGIPSYFVVDGSEKILRDGKGYRSADRFLDWLD
jgi:thiol:disulfide interchange protein DsbD